MGDDLARQMGGRLLAGLPRFAKWDTNVISTAQRNPGKPLTLNLHT
jgi:hypothetical protein